MEPLKPKEVQLGNFILCFDKVEMVTGLIPQGENSWFICHQKWHQNFNPIPEDIQFSAYPVLLTDDWKKCLKIDNYNLPEWIKYVHQAQNYMKWFADVDLLDIMDWDLFKKCI